MAKTTTKPLDDLALVLLSTASGREDGSVLPAAASVAGEPERVEQALAGLVRRKLVAECAAPDQPRTWRERDGARIGLVLTHAGRAALGLADGAGEGGVPEPAPEPITAPPAPAATPVRQTKAALVLALLSRSDGATLAELIAATGWLPHTTRAALTGLRRKGHGIVTGKRDATTCYRIAAA